MTEANSRPRVIDKNKEDMMGSTLLKYRTKKHDETSHIILIPVYARMEVLNLITLDIQEMAAEVNAILRVIYFYGNLEPSIV